MNHQSQIRTNILPATWVGRVITILIATALAVVGLFFVAFALIAVAVLAAIVAVRMWWIFRKLRAQQDKDVIEGAYSIESEQTHTVRSEGTNDGAPK